MKLNVRIAGVLSLYPTRFIINLAKRYAKRPSTARTAKLEAARQMDAQRAEIEERAVQKVIEERRFKDLETEKRIGDLTKALEDANRKAQQGSQQLQGEVQELDLEAFLKEQFPLDEIKPVAKGVRVQMCFRS